MRGTEAICEAVRRPTMRRFVQAVSAEQQSQLMLHRTRDLFDAATDPGDQCLAGAYGRARHYGCTRERRARGLLAITSRAAAGRRLPAKAGATLIVLAAGLQTMRTLIASIGGGLLLIIAWTKQAKRAAEHPGDWSGGPRPPLSPITDPKAFRSGRDMADWIRLVPGRIKRRQTEARTDLETGRSVFATLPGGGSHAVLKLARQKPEKYPWLTQLLARKPFKIAAVALANKWPHRPGALLD